MREAIKDLATALVVTGAYAAVTVLAFLVVFAFMAP